jgi:hypothetical protein
MSSCEHVCCAAVAGLRAVVARPWSSCLGMGGAEKEGGSGERPSMRSRMRKGNTAATTPPGARVVLTWMSAFPMSVSLPARKRYQVTG